MKKYEVPQKWALLEEGFTTERGMMTPKMSVKRHIVMKVLGFLAYQLRGECLHLQTANRMQICSVIDFWCVLVWLCSTFDDIADRRRFSCWPLKFAADYLSCAHRNTLAPLRHCMLIQVHKLHAKSSRKRLHRN